MHLHRETGYSWLRTSLEQLTYITKQSASARRPCRCQTFQLLILKLELYACLIEAVAIVTLSQV